MKCLTYEETRIWLDSFSVKIGEHRHLSFASFQNRLMVTLPREAHRLQSLSSCLNDWLPNNHSRLLWLSNWETDPPEQIVLFEKVRLGCGESRHVIDAPAHLFEAPILQERVVLSGLVFLILALNWEGYLVADSCNDHVYLGDECLSFFSADDKKLKVATDMVQSFGLKVITDIKEAWRKE